MIGIRDGFWNMFQYEFSNCSPADIEIEIWEFQEFWEPTSKIPRIRKKTKKTQKSFSSSQFYNREYGGVLKLYESRNKRPNNPEINQKILRNP